MSTKRKPFYQELERGVVIINPKFPNTWPDWFVHPDEMEVKYPDGSKGPDRSYLPLILYSANGALTPEFPSRPPFLKRLDSWLWKMAIEG